MHIDFQHGSEARTGVLLANLGTPEAPTTGAVRRYLKQFLSDRRVIEFNPILWWFILHGIILNFRPKKSAHAYQRVWRAEGSPLLYFSQQQLHAVQAALEHKLRKPVLCELGMRYGQPSLNAAMRKLRHAGARRLIVLPLYPQYSATTTASVFDAVFDELKSWRWMPELRLVNDYYDAPGYIQAIANRIQAHWKTYGQADKLLFSFHSIPKQYFLSGDPYACMCEKTVRKVVELLQLQPDRWLLCYQSRIGKQEWLKPYTDISLKELAHQGVKSIDVVCPGFAADCLETLEEIAITDRDLFLRAGGERYHYIPALNDGADHIHALTDLLIKHMQGWPETDPHWHASSESMELKRSHTLALSKGAPQ